MPDDNPHPCLTMNIFFASIDLRATRCGLLAASLGASAVLAATPPAGAEAQARYRQDLAACDSGTSAQTQETCRLEARNALAEARRGRLGDALGPEQYQANALQRCAVHQGDDRVACEARMRGAGSVEGSVGQGGLLRELVTPAAGR